ncbi:MAG: phosphoribosylformylglycinamidine cyclo-ligase [Phycisphaerae bacterium]|nr:phosphoribosylformylglycinamidine cyclo-ligase [Phycisphaerae bacterium]
MAKRKGSARGRGDKGLSYADAGVDLQSKDAFTESLDSVMRRTFSSRVIPNPGGFAGLFRLDFNEKLFRRNYKDPVLVACADGVGTKVRLAVDLQRYDTVGIDLVAMNINDMIVQGAEPLFFLDYIAVGKVDPHMLGAIVRGVAEGCRRAGCALLGGETAEMAGMYQGRDFDLAGFAVGVVELDRAVRPLRVEVGDVVLGLASDGVHSNGYSLVRKIVAAADLDLSRAHTELGPSAPASRRGRRSRSATGAPTLGDVLLTPTRIYASPIMRLMRGYRVKKVISGMAHITGSGLAGNLCRALNPRVDALVRRSSWSVPPIFRFLQERGGVDDEEMRRVFNMGIGYCVIVKPAFAKAAAQTLARFGERVSVIGEIVKGRGEVREIE